MSLPGLSLPPLPPGKFVTLGKIKPTGSLQARLQSNGTVNLYWRYSLGTQSERVLIGRHDASAPPKQLTPSKGGYTVAAAIRTAEGLAIDHHNHRDQGGRPALLAAQEQAAAEAAAAQARTNSATLKHLLFEYCDFLERSGKESHREARSLFRLHVAETAPDVASKPAIEVSAEEFADLMRRLIEAGKGRSANKLRSYAHAAYEMALAAKTSPVIPERFKDFGVQSNPLRATKADPSANKADKNPLTLAELRLYWQLIKDIPGLKGGLLRLHLLTGGQRIQQLLRLVPSDIKDDYFILMDGKGRPPAPVRPHWVPITPSVRLALNDCCSSGPYAFTTDGGKTQIYCTTFSNWAKDVASEHIPNFNAKRVRSGVETALASAKVPLEARGRLQSHGVAGVQAKHYDGHDYLDVKRDALLVLERLLKDRRMP